MAKPPRKLPSQWANDPKMRKLAGFSSIPTEVPTDPEFVAQTKRKPAGGAIRPPAIDPTFDELLGVGPDFLS